MLAREKELTQDNWADLFTVHVPGPTNIQLLPVLKEVRDVLAALTTELGSTGSEHGLAASGTMFPIQPFKEPGMVAHTCNLSAWEDKGRK